MQSIAKKVPPYTLTSPRWSGSLQEACRCSLGPEDHQEPQVHKDRQGHVVVGSAVDGSEAQEVLGEVLQGQVQEVEEEDSPPQAQSAHSEDSNVPWPGSTSKVLNVPRC